MKWKKKNEKEMLKNNTTEILFMVENLTVFGRIQMSK